MNAKVILYTLPGCDVCDAARAGLTSEGTEFEERDVLKQRSWWDEVLTYSNAVPVILRGEKVEIGWKGVVG